MESIERSSECGAIIGASRQRGGDASGLPVAARPVSSSDDKLSVRVRAQAVGSYPRDPSEVDRASGQSLTPP